MVYSKGRDLLTRLDPADRDVELVQDCCPPTTGVVAGLSRFQLLTQMSDVVASVRVVGLEGSLTDSRDWVTSTVSGYVEEVLKADALGPVPGERLFLEYGEGAVALGERTIRSRRTWAAPLEEGAVYLVFLTRGQNGELLDLEPSNVFSVVSDSYRSLVIDSEFATPAAIVRQEIADSAPKGKLRFGGPR
jgi:hypothetical protein